MRGAVATRTLDLDQALAQADALFRSGRKKAANRVVDAVCAALPTETMRLELRAKVALQRGHLDEAFARTERLARLDPQRLGQFLEIGAFLVKRGRFDDARLAFERFVQARPELPEAHYDLAHALLALGRYERGLAEYEWRYAMKQARGYLETDPARLWDGRDLAGGTLLLDTEQGFGDAIQLARYTGWAAERAGRVVLRAPPELARLLGTAAGVTEVVTRGEPVPDRDAYCPLGRLPFLHGTRPETIPEATPYLAASDAARRRWRERLAGVEGLRVGLVWSGNPRNADDGPRSIPVEALRPLLDLDGAAFFSLQLGARAGDLDDARVTDLAPGLTDFDETAAALGALDALVTVETAVSHLAAALGREAQVLLAHAPDWRYAHAPARRRWFPTLRFHQQSRPGEWGPVVDAARGALARAIEARA